MMLSFGCSSEKTKQEALQDESINEVEQQTIREFGTRFNIDGQKGSMIVYYDKAGVSVKVEYLEEEQSMESISKLSELDGMLVAEKYRLVQGNPKPLLAIYATDRDGERNQVIFYKLDEKMVFQYMGKIVDEDNFIELGEIKIIEDTVVFGSKSYEMADIMLDRVTSTTDKDKFLEYLGQPAYSIVSELGQADTVDKSLSEESWSYLDEGLELQILQGDIVGTIITSGRILGIEVNQEFSEEKWENYDRYALETLSTSSNRYLVAHFDYGKYFVELHLLEENNSKKIVSIGVSLSELYQARLKEDHVVVDRFGNLLFAENKDSWSAQLKKEDGWLQIKILGYERENAVLFFQAKRVGVVGVYHYDLLKQKATLLMENPESVEFSGGTLRVSTTGERRYFDLGGIDVTDKIMGIDEDDIQVEFYIQSDTLFYLPENTRDYLVLKNLSQLLEDEYIRIETSFDPETNRGFLSAFKETKDELYDLYVFYPELSQIKLLDSGILAHEVIWIHNEKGITVTNNNSTRCYDLDGNMLDNCDGELN